MAQTVQIAVLADIHGNLPALEAVLADLPPNLSAVVVAGDLAGGGPYPLECLRRLQALGAWVIRGNNEDYLTAFDRGQTPPGWRTGQQWAVMRWAYRQLDRDALNFVTALPAQGVLALEGCAPIRVVHGSLRSTREGLYPDRDPERLALFRQAGMLAEGESPAPLSVALAGVDEPVLICAHVHIPWRQEEGGCLALNPGAVGGSDDGDARAKYALLTWNGSHWQVEHRAVAYDLDRTRRAFQESGLLAAGDGLARAVLADVCGGRNLTGRLVGYAYKLAREAGMAAEAEARGAVPDEIWERAVQTFAWGQAPQVAW